MSRSRRRVVMPAVIALLLVTMAVPAGTALADVSGGVITGVGPLTKIAIGGDLTCAVNHEGDVYGEFYGDTACATLLATGGTLYGPATIPAGQGAAPRTAWSTVSQTGSGSGLASDPYRVVTVVEGGGLQLTETDTYVEGAESYGTRVAVENTGEEARSFTLYRAGDCYLQDSDVGYGALDADSGAVSCTTGTDAGSRIEQWAPLTPGSHAYESTYGNVWARIGAQQPFPDSCDCDAHEDNGAGLSWTATVPPGTTQSFSHLTAFSPSGVTRVEDSDGDGLPDQWESPDGGVDTDGDGQPDLKLSDYGATPDKPDVFVQVDSTSERSCFLFFCSTRNHRPSLAAMRDVQEAFDDHGVRLHVDAGPESLMDPDSGATWGDRSQVHDSVEAPDRLPGYDEATGGFDWGQAFDGIRARVMSSERARIFHLALYIGTFNAAGNTGLSRSSQGSDFAGRDFLVAHGAFGDHGPSRIEEAGTFMHELGHNLGLSHGGAAEDGAVNWKPNYPSVMNYSWQLSGTYKHDTLGLLDYSEGTLDPLDESRLSEEDGLEPDPVALDIGTKWVCPGQDRADGDPVPSAFDVDWNCSGDIDAGTYAGNVNGPGTPDVSVLYDHDDWHSLILDGGGALGGAGDAQAPASVTHADEPPVRVLEDSEGDLHTVEVIAPGQLTIQAHTAAPVAVRLVNHHDQARTYGLQVLAAGGVSLTGLPSRVTLAAGQARTLTAVLKAGDATDGAYTEVDATSDQPTDQASAITEIAVVDRRVADQPALPGGGSTPPAPKRPPAARPSPKPGSAPSAPKKPDRTFPAKLRIRRAEVRHGRLHLLLSAARRANGDRVKVTVKAHGSRHRYGARIAHGRLRLDRRLPKKARHSTTAAITLRYAGSARVRPVTIRFLAAPHRAHLKRTALSLKHGGRLHVAGTIARRARGSVRLALSFDTPGGPALWTARAKLAHGRWSLTRKLPKAARGGGYLAIEYAGDRSRGLRGERIGAEVG